LTSCGYLTVWCVTSSPPHINFSVHFVENIRQSELPKTKLNLGYDMNSIGEFNNG